MGDAGGVCGEAGVGGQLGPAGEVIPPSIISKAPSAELRPDQTDQDSLPPYPILDEIIEGLVEEELPLVGGCAGLAGGAAGADVGDLADGPVGEVHPEEVVALPVDDRRFVVGELRGDLAITGLGQPPLVAIAPVHQVEVSSHAGDLPPAVLAEIAVGTRHGGFLVEGVQWQSDGYKDLDGGGDTGFDKSEVMAKLRLNSDIASELYHALRLKLGYAREASNETYLGLSDEDFAQNPDRRYRASMLDRMDWDRTQLELRYRFEFGSDFELTAVAYRHDFHRIWRKLNGFRDTTPVADVLANPFRGNGMQGVVHGVLDRR